MKYNWRDQQPRGYSRPIICRTILILFRVTAGWSYAELFGSYFGLQQADLNSALGETRVTAGKTTMAAGKINYGCFEMLSWPHRTLANIINICFCLLETCTKCSYFIEKNIRPGAQQLAFEVKFEYIAHRSTNIPWAGFLRLGKFPDKRRLKC